MTSPQDILIIKSLETRLALAIKEVAELKAANQTLEQLGKHFKALVTECEDFQETGSKKFLITAGGLSVLLESIKS